jgi:hypothetical protein
VARELTRAPLAAVGSGLGVLDVKNNARRRRLEVGAGVPRRRRAGAGAAATGCFVSAEPRDGGRI